MTKSFLFLKKMKKTTLIYIEKDDRYLMLHRNKKEHDINKDKWIGVGGHVEDNETIDECIVREVKEETNLDLISYKLRGEVLFVLNGYEELMYVYTSNEFQGTLNECDEGTLEWIDKNKVLNLPIWEGDKLIFDSLNKDEYFRLKLVYVNNELIFSENY